MTMMSAGIAVLGLLLSSPAVVIGAMLISPLMNPILGLGFSLALFDFAELRRSLSALAIGATAALLFTAFIVLVSPLKAPTAEILARTRPNLFDLLVALFAALAGTFAIIRGRGETIVGVAIATALMPPLAGRLVITPLKPPWKKLQLAAGKLPPPPAVHLKPLILQPNRRQ